MYAARHRCICNGCRKQQSASERHQPHEIPHTCLQGTLRAHHRNAFININTSRTVEDLMRMWIARVSGNVICHHDNNVLLG